MSNEEVNYAYPRKCSEMAIHKSSGVTESEERLCRLGYHTFLSLWSYPNVFQKHKLVKELCDLLVVFENHIIIFSDKDCAFGNSGDITTDWIRWYKKSILASAKQLCGAKSWICKCPDRICLDEKGEVDFPLNIEVTDKTQFHLIAVAHGAADACKEYFQGGDGGLIITNEPPLDIKDRDNCSPFEIGRILSEEGTFIHVFDDSSYATVLQEVDTISDFVEYLSDKEKLYLSNASVSATSENELLAFHVSGLIEGRTTRLYDLTHECGDVDTVTIEEGHWEELLASQRYRDWRKQLKSSYFWDSLLQRTFYYIENGLSLTTTPTIEAQSELFRYLARENRFHRASLAHSFLSFFSNTPEDFRGTRIIYNQDDPSICYVLFLLPRKQYMEDADYRKVRIDMLRDYCAIAKSDLPQVQMVIGVAHETNEEFGSSEDFAALDAREWTAEDQEQALQVKEEYISKGLIGKRNHIACSYHRTTAPEIRRLKGKDRNKPCPCGSGKKYKKCCGAIRQ